jgi:tetratricopeptide (TPR) repeat protein
MLKRYNAIYLSILLFVMFLSSCQEQYPPLLQHANDIILENPDRAYSILIKMQGSIKDEPKSAQMYYQILLCRAQDLCFVPHNSDSVMKKVVMYYQKHKNKELLMQAYYCMGCIYRDMNEVPRSMNYYQKAIDISTSGNNYSLIARCYNQIGQIEENAYSTKDALKSYKKALSYFIKAKELHTIPLATVDIASIYHELGNESIAFKYIKQAEYSARFDKNVFSSVKIEKFRFYIDDKNYMAAENIYDRIDTKASSVASLQYGMYMCKAFVLKQHNKYDSAVYYFNKALASASDDKERQYSTYLYLAKVYEDNLHDEYNALKYNKLALDKIDTIRKEDNDKVVQQIQSLYDYNKAEKENQKLNIENENIKQHVGTLIICLFIGAVVWLIYMLHIKRHEIQLERIIVFKDIQYNESLECFKKNEKEIAKLREINDKLSNLKIATLEKNNDKIKSEIKQQEQAWENFRSSDIYYAFHNIIKDNMLICTHKDVVNYLNELKVTIDYYFNGFGKRLYQYYPSINNTQIKICYLIKAEVRLIDMAQILSLSKPAISNARHDIKSKCFQKSATMDDVDRFIHEL